ncbi:MAG: hypothetical protein OEY03_12255, partial [Rhizobacter sp.]|nr:hypothetical protein [Rhizobacter sp.]
RARRYLTTYANIDQPWRAWSTLGAHFDPVDSGWFGTAYIAVGHMHTAAPHPAGHHQRRENRT